MSEVKSAAVEQITKLIDELERGAYAGVPILVVTNDKDAVVDELVANCDSVQAWVVSPAAMEARSAPVVIVDMDDSEIQKCARMRARGPNAVVISFTSATSGWLWSYIEPKMTMRGLREYITAQLAESALHRGLSVDVRIDDVQWLKGAFLTLLTESERIVARSMGLERRALKNETWRLAAQRILNAGMDAYVDENDSLAQGLRSLASDINESCDAVDGLSDPK